jgi:hypothetical protein
MVEFGSLESKRLARLAMNGWGCFMRMYTRGRLIAADMACRL